MWDEISPESHPIFLISLFHQADERNKMSRKIKSVLFFADDNSVRIELQNGVILRVISNDYNGKIILEMNKKSEITKRWPEVFDLIYDVTDA